MDLYSFSKDFYKNPTFVEAFGVAEPSPNKKYGLLNPKGHNIILPDGDEIKQFTVEDGDIIKKFVKLNEKYENEKYGFRSYELTDFYDTIKRGSEMHRIYGYLRKDIMAAFVTVCIHSADFCNIGSIYSSPEYRGSGMASSLAKYYINEFIDKGTFISYGNAINEASEKTATSAGFELHSETWLAVV